MQYLFYGDKYTAQGSLLAQERGLQYHHRAGERRCGPSLLAQERGLQCHQRVQGRRERVSLLAQERGLQYCLLIIALERRGRSSRRSVGCN